MIAKWFGLGVLAILLVPSMASGAYQIQPPQYEVGEWWEWVDENGVESMTQTVLGEEPDYYIFDIQVDVQGPQHFWAILEKENAGVSRVWGTFIEQLDVILDPPFSLFPLREYQEGELMFHVYSPMRIDVLLTFRSEIVGVEEITVPAGTYETYHMSQEYDVIYGITYIDIWYSPEVRQYIKIDIRQMPFVGDLFFELSDYELLM
jgi:hypothetical protein